MWPRLQARALNGIVVEAIPLLKRLGSVFLVFIIAPLKHLGCVVNADLLAVYLEDSLGVLQQVIRVNDSDGGPTRPVAVDTVTVRPRGIVQCLVQRRGLACPARANDALCKQVVKEAAQLIVTCFRGHEVVEACDGVQRRDGAAVVGRNRAARVADQKSPVEATEHVGRHDGGIVLLLDRAVCGAVDEAIGVVGDMSVVAVCVAAVALIAVGQGVAAEKRRRKRNMFAIWWEKIVCDVLDEDSLALFRERR